MPGEFLRPYSCPRTHGELAALLTDLPAASGWAAGAAAPEPKDVLRIDCHSSSVKRDGRWVVPLRMEVRATSGTVELDFTAAVIARPSLHIDADVRSGVLTLVTKPRPLRPPRRTFWQWLRRRPRPRALTA